MGRKRKNIKTDLTNIPEVFNPTRACSEQAVFVSVVTEVVDTIREHKLFKLMSIHQRALVHRAVLYKYLAGKIKYAGAKIYKALLDIVNEKVDTITTVLNDYTLEEIVSKKDGFIKLIIEHDLIFPAYEFFKVLKISKPYFQIFKKCWSFEGCEMTLEIASDIKTELKKRLDLLTAQKVKLDVLLPEYNNISKNWRIK